MVNFCCCPGTSLSLSLLLSMFSWAVAWPTSRFPDSGTGIQMRLTVHREHAMRSQFSFDLFCPFLFRDCCVVSDRFVLSLSYNVFRFWWSLPSVTRHYGRRGYITGTVLLYWYNIFVQHMIDALHRRIAGSG